MAKTEKLKKEQLKNTKFSEIKNSVYLPSKRLVFIVCIVLSFVLYGNTINNGYAMDDELVTLHQKNVEMGFSGIPRILTSRYSVNQKQNYEYRPIVLISFAIEYQFFGRNPTVSHFFNILLYAVLCFVLYNVFLKLFGNAVWPLILLMTLLFIIHPIHNEVVASLKNRDEILALLFGLLSFNAFIKFSENPKWKYVVYGVLLLTIALLSKKSAMAFIGLVPVILIYLKANRKTILKYSLITGGIILVLVLAFRIFVILVVAKNGGVSRDTFFFENPLYDGSYSVIERLFFSLATVGFYIKMMFVPYPLVCYYGYNTFDGFHFSIFHIIGILAIGLLVYLAIKNRNKNKILFIAAFWILATLFLLSNLVAPMVGIVAERFALVTSIGFCLLFAIFILKIKPHISFDSVNVWYKFLNSGQRIFVVSCIVISAIYIINRNKAWYSHQSLYKNDIKLVPKSAKLHSLLGTYYASILNESISGKRKPLSQDEMKLYSDSAIAHFKRALLIYPDYIAVNNNIGTMYFSFKNNYDSAKYYFAKAIDLDNEYTEAYYNYGSVMEYFAEVDYDKLKFVKEIIISNETATCNTDSVIANINGFTQNFLCVTLMKANIEKIINGAFGNSKEGPINAIGNTIMYFHSSMNDDVKSLIDAQQMAQQIVSSFTNENKMKIALNPGVFIDSVVNHCYHEYFSKVLIKGKVDQRQKEKLIEIFNKKNEETKESCLSSLRMSLKYNKEYILAYNKLVTLLEKWKMPDEMIKANDLVYGAKGYKDFTIDFTYARAYYLKNDFKNITKYVEHGLLQLEKIISRYKKAGQNFSVAGNGNAASACLKTVELNKNNVARVAKFYLNILNQNGFANECKKLTSKLDSIMKI